MIDFAKILRARATLRAIPADPTRAGALAAWLLIETERTESKQMTARRTTERKLNNPIGVRFAPELITALDAFILRKNASDAYAVDPIGRTDVIRRALAAYLAGAAAYFADEGAK